MHQLPPDIAGGGWNFGGNDGIGGQGDTSIAAGPHRR
jgi:hypothetical protein